MQKTTMRALDNATLVVCATQEHLLEKKKHPTQWVKGQSGNPSGGKRYSKEMIEANRVAKSPAEIKIVASKVLDMPVEEIEDLIKDKKQPILIGILGQIAYKAYLRGDPRRLNSLLDRVCGKPKQEIEMSAAVSFDVDKGPWESLTDPSKI